MAAQKGHAKAGGRKAGTPNKVGADVRALAKSYGEDAIRLLAVEMKSAEQSGDRVRAAMALLDRGYGKPAQQTIVTGDDENGPVRHVFVWED